MVDIALFRLKRIKNIVFLNYDSSFRDETLNSVQGFIPEQLFRV